MNGITKIKITFILVAVAVIILIVAVKTIKCRIQALKNKKKETKIEKTSANNLVNRTRSSCKYKRRIKSFTDRFFAYTDSKLKEFYSGTENRNRPSDK